MADPNERCRFCDHLGGMHDRELGPCNEGGCDCDCFISEDQTSTSSRAWCAMKRCDDPQRCERDGCQVPIAEADRG